MITLPRALVLGLAALFSAYHIALALSSLGTPASPWPAVVAMALYAVATVLSLWPTSPRRMSLGLASFNLAVAFALPVLVTSQLDPTAGDNGYATWHVAAVGTLMTITMTRLRPLFAWLGVGFLAVQTVLWDGVAALGGIGVIGSVVWVMIAFVLTRALAKAARDARQFALAEQEATEWQAAQDAHLYERRFRLEQTTRLSLPMLTRIVDVGGRLTDVERLECRTLEATIRDEIRGRMLLNDSVREQVRVARDRGAVVSLLDEGGIDDLSPKVRERVLAQLAAAIASTDAGRIIARTVSDGSETAVTVVGLTQGGDGRASALGQESLDDDVDLWLEIPRG